MKPFPAAARARHLKDLLEVTAVPTATGCEHRVIAWVERWCRRRKVVVERDEFGNLMLIGVGAPRTDHPLVLAAHLDHPAFVVTAVAGRTVTAEFRGGVQDAYFAGTRVRLWPAAAPQSPGMVGRVTAVTAPDPAVPGSFMTATLRFRQAPVPAATGDFATWDLDGSVIRSGRLRAPVCDNLAGLAAGLAAFGEWLKRRGTQADRRRDVRFLCTRAEEVGFVGAIAAARSGLLPAGSRVVVLENSKASDHAPQGGGPVVRVGDATRTFSPGLTAEVARAAADLAGGDRAAKRSAFVWQRKLMTGGTCEASAYLAYGYRATCVCLPLGNYHNMDEGRTKIAREFIAVDDFHGMVRLLYALAAAAGDPAAADPLRARLDGLFAGRRRVLDPV